MIDMMNLFIAIFPFIFGLVIIALIPSKEKILSRQIKKYGAEKFIVLHLIAFIFILPFGVYYIMSLFGDGSGDQYISIFNGAILITIAVGVMALNSRNFALFTKLEGGTGAELGLESVQEVTPVEPIIAGEEKAKPIRRKIEPEMVECPGCGKVIKIMATERPLKISCPHCGIEGMIQ